MDGEPGTPGRARGGLHIPPVVLKVLITVAVGTGTYVITNLVDQSEEELWQIALAVLIGGATLIVQYMVDFEQRLGSVETGQRQNRRELGESLTARHDEMKELVDQGFRRVSEVTELFSRLDASGMPSDEISRLVRSAAHVGSQSRGIVKEFARAEITRVASMMTALTSWGSADWEGENNDLLIALTRCVRESIYATSSFVDLAFWKTATAKHYLDVQREAIRCGVKVRRLFIVQIREEFDDLDEILQEQRSAGIEAGVLVLSELRSDIRVGETLDVVILDEELYFEIKTDVQQLNPNARLEARAPHVTRRKERFDKLWDACGEGPPELRGR